MKAKTKSLALVILSLLILATGAAACSNKAETAETGNEAAETVTVTREDLYGTWTGIGNETGGTLSFSKDGQCRDSHGDLAIAGPYSLDEAAQTLTVTDTEIGMNFTYDITMENDQLTIQMNGGNPRTFVKKK